MKTHLELAQLFQEIRSWETIGTDTQYKIIEYQDEVVIIFCPSNSKADWRINFSFPKKPYKRMAVPFLVHGGFLGEWKKINDHFILQARKILAGSGAYKKITITGWSYGGAMATLCQEDLWYNFPWIRANLRLVTFGSPRVIGWANSGKIRQRWRSATLYSNGTDIVTMVPPAVFGFKHVRRQTHIGSRRTFLGVFNPRKYHHIDGYVSSLQGVSQ